MGRVTTKFVREKTIMEKAFIVSGVWLNGFPENMEGQSCMGCGKGTLIKYDTVSASTCAVLVNDKNNKIGCDTCGYDGRGEVEYPAPFDAHTQLGEHAFQFNGTCEVCDHRSVVQLKKGLGCGGSENLEFCTTCLSYAWVNWGETVAASPDFEGGCSAEKKEKVSNDFPPGDWFEPFRDQLQLVEIEKCPSCISGQTYLAFVGEQPLRFAACHTCHHRYKPSEGIVRLKIYRQILKNPNHSMDHMREKASELGQVFMPPDDRKSEWNVDDFADYYANSFDVDEELFAEVFTEVVRYLGGDPTAWVNHDTPKADGLYWVTMLTSNGERTVVPDCFTCGKWKKYTGCKIIAHKPRREPLPYLGVCSDE